MHDDYTAVWELSRQRVTQATTELRLALLEASGEDRTVDACLDLLYQGVTGHSLAWLHATLGVAEPADTMSVTRLYLLWIALRSALASTCGYPVLGYQPGAPPRPEAEAEIVRLLAWEREHGIDP